ncbi:Lrp/AsnC family transcriptional regulator [Marinibactrum halimedae]|uniref:AsnC family transcriptional regulator n=1 Tax=Marinibactrum halimedae TaxID=1444977 RepID=A0AA37T2E3_9GAMM|nr:Lrp/AsnC family transcriptional regulator [Marinibactrum halimedae]MCD9457762.1 Lrp/AsnC family transcriptional regulator [Marinibactrum halimedae]GLS24864.1 AsnC family transcriptional regulator [Marinibactrum halimedae]
MSRFLDTKDEALLTLLRQNARESTSELARQLKLSRTTVKERIDRLVSRGIIHGFTVKFNEDYTQSLIRAHVLMSVRANQNTAAVKGLEKISRIQSLYAVNGTYDLIALVEATSTGELDQTLDQIGNVTGVEKTVSSILLSTKLER